MNTTLNYTNATQLLQQGKNKVYSNKIKNLIEILKKSERMHMRLFFLLLNYLYNNYMASSLYTNVSTE